MIIKFYFLSHCYLCCDPINTSYVEDLICKTWTFRRVPRLWNSRQPRRCLTLCVDISPTNLKATSFWSWINKAIVRGIWTGYDITGMGNNVMSLSYDIIMIVCLSLWYHNFSNYDLEITEDVITNLWCPIWYPYVQPSRCQWLTRSRSIDGAWAALEPEACSTWGLAAEQHLFFQISW